MRIGILITVRTGSTRLPNKALREIHSTPIISYLIRRIKASVGSQQHIILCTTDLDEDDVLCRLAEKEGISYFKGDKANIIKRHLVCADQYDLDFIINIDGDDILSNVEYINKIACEHESNKGFDVIKTVGLPFGTNVMGYKKEILEIITKEYSLSEIETGWGRLINDYKRFKVQELKSLDNEKLDDRMTLYY